MIKYRYRHQILFVFLCGLLLISTSRSEAQEIIDREKKNVIETTFFIANHQTVFDPFTPEIGYGRQLYDYFVAGIYWKPDFYGDRVYKSNKFVARLDVSMAKILANYTQVNKKWDLFPSINYQYRFDKYKMFGDDTDSYHYFRTGRIVFGAGLSHNISNRIALLFRYNFTFERELYFGLRYHF